MKCLNNSHVSELRSIAAVIVSFVLATASEAALYTTSANTYMVQSWANPVWQPGFATPTSGNTYEILSGGVLRNPRGTAPIFPGDSLTVDSGARLQLVGNSPETLTF